MLGISVGVLVLIVALSVINGSIAVMRDEALKSVPHAIVSGENLSSIWAEEIAEIKEQEGIIAAAPFVEGEAMIRHQGGTRFIRLRGVAPELEFEVINNTGEGYRELLEELHRTENGIVLGTQLAGSLRIYDSQKLTVISLGKLLKRNLSEAQGFDVVGFADFGIYGNNNIALVNLDSAKQLFSEDPGVDFQIRVKVDDIFQAKNIVERSTNQQRELTVTAWSEVQANLFNALNMEKILTGFMLLMIVAIGAFNIVSTLVMVVSDKGKDIAILRTMGASRLTIIKIFVVQGMISGIVGTIVGVFGGVIVATNISGISLFLENILNAFFLDQNIYLISHLQTKLIIEEIVFVCFIALVISFIVTLYPAYKASEINPAETLRYE
jgi:lipoprotein-releasing system permease protein